MAIPMGPTTTTLVVSFAALGGCGFWWQCGHIQIGASTQYDSEVGEAIEAQVETIAEDAHRSNAHDKAAEAGLQDVPLSTQQRISENVAAKDIEPLFEAENPAHGTNREANVQEETPEADLQETAEQDIAATNALAEKPSQEVTFTESDVSKEKEALVVETPGIEQEDAAANAMAENLGGEAVYSDTGSFSIAQEIGKGEVGTDKDSTSIYHIFDAPFWMPALGFALACDAAALMFVAVCCRKLLKRSSGKDEDLSDTPFEVTHTPPTFQEAKKPSLDEPIEELSEEEEEGETKSSATISLEVECQESKTGMDAGFDYTQIPSPIGKRSSANDPFRFQ